MTRHVWSWTVALQAEIRPFVLFLAIFISLKGFIKPTDISWRKNAACEIDKTFLMTVDLLYRLKKLAICFNDDFNVQPLHIVPLTHVQVYLYWLKLLDSFSTVENETPFCPRLWKYSNEEAVVSFVHEYLWYSKEMRPVKKEKNGNNAVDMCNLIGSVCLKDILSVSTGCAGWFLLIFWSNKAKA